MYLNAIHLTKRFQKSFQSRNSELEKIKMSSSTAPVAAGAGPVKQSLEELENEKAYLKSKLTKVNAKIDTYISFMSRVDAALDARLGIPGTTAVKYMDIKSEKLPLLISRSNSMFLRLKVLRKEISRLRQQKRCKELKEEIIAAAFHPKRVEKWLEQGGFEALDGF